MIKLDVVKAAFAGFGVIGRNPLAVLVWGVFLLVVGVLPILGVFGGFMASIMQLAALETAGAEPTPEQVMPLLGSFFAMMPVLMIVGLVLRTVLAGAVFRAVLFPEDRRWFYLRLGTRELWLGLLMVVFGVLMFAIYMVLSLMMIPFMIAAGASGAGMNPDDPAAAAGVMLMIIPLYFVMLGVMVFLFVRFGMAFPMTFAQSQFRLFESWTLTRGNSWNIVLVGLLLFAMLIGLELVAGILIVLVVAAVAGAGAASGWTEDSLEAFFAQDPSVILGAVAPWAIIGGLVACILGAALTAILTAPWAEAYRQLSAGSQPSPAAEPETVDVST